MNNETNKETEEAVAKLEADGNFKVLRRLERKERYSDKQGSMRGLIVDIETTGLDSGADKIIQLAMVPFTYDALTGTVGEVGEAYTGMEDPGFAISQEITDLTGITNEDVKGKGLDEKVVKEMLEGVNIIIAHNAEFDRPFLDERLPIFQKKAWACSQRDIGWKKRGTGSEKLEWLLYTLHQKFYDAHRALDDCLATLHLLATPTADGLGAPLAELLANARRKEVMVWAFQSPFEAKGLLKKNDYKWWDREMGGAKCWRKVVVEDEAQKEVDWLARVVYSGKNTDEIEVTEYNRKIAFSNRSAGYRHIKPTPELVKTKGEKKKGEKKREGVEQGSLKLG